MTSIYLVDDHLIVRDGLRAVLQTAGHQVVGETADPTQALADLQRLRPQVLLLDLQLGAHSGLELLRALQARPLDVRTLVLSMSAQPRHVADALRLGALGYLLKGSGMQDLLHAIDVVAQGRRHLGPEVADLALQGLDPEQSDPLGVLSARERHVLMLVVRGHSSAAIGEQLHLSPKTVDTYRSRLMSKLGVGDLPGLVLLAVRTGLIDAG